MSNEENIYITKSEIEQIWDASDIKPWVDLRIEQICATKKGQKALRSRNDKYLKRLIEEVLPFGIFCNNYFQKDSEVKVQMLTGNQNYDAEILNECFPFKFVEIVQANERYSDALRRQALNKYGKINALGTISKNKDNEISCNSVTRKHSEILNEHLVEIREVSINKSNKKYPNKTALLICIDDSKVFRTMTELNMIKKYIGQECYSKFSAIFIIGLTTSVYQAISNSPAPN